MLSQMIQNGSCSINHTLVNVTVYISVKCSKSNRGNDHFHDCDDVFSGYSEENKLVNFTGHDLKEGEIYDVLITGAKSYTLDGEAVSGHLENKEN